MYTSNQNKKQPWIQYQANDPNAFTVIERSSEDYKKFISRIEKNYSGSNKLSVCTLCWGFIAAIQKKRHAEHEPFMFTASFFKNEESFLQLCIQNGKISGNRQSVIIFKESVQFAGTPGYNPTGGTSSFQGGENPLVNLKDILKKSHEQDCQIKRMNITVTQVRDDLKTEDTKLDKLETQIRILKQQVLQYAKDHLNE
eukprot:403337649